MKKILFIGLALFSVLLFGALSKPEDNKILVQTKDAKLADWEWTSGEVDITKTAAKECFTISFDPKIYRPRDSVRIIFSSYKVSLGNVDKGTKIGQWSGKVSLVYFINNNWIPLVSDTNDRINQPFTGKNNVLEDGLKNYTLLLTVPLSHTLTITASVLSFEKDNHMGSLILQNGKTGITLTTSIKGIEVGKILRN